MAATAFHRGPIGRLDSGYHGSMRQTRDAAAVTCENGYGRFYELASRGQVYCAMVSSVIGSALPTVDSGLATAANPQQMTAAATPILAILNPMSSGVVFEILQGILCFVSSPGDQIVGAWSWCGNNAGRKITAAEASATKAPLYLGQRPTQAKAWSLVALTGAPVQPVIRPFPAAIFVDTVQGITSNTQGCNTVDNVDGAIVVPPGGLLSLAAPFMAAAKSITTIASIMYAEVPAPAYPVNPVT